MTQAAMLMRQRTPLRDAGRLPVWRYGNWRHPREDVTNSDRLARGRNSYRRKLVWKLREALRMRKAYTVSENSHTDCP